MFGQGFDSPQLHEFPFTRCKTPANRMIYRGFLVKQPPTHSGGHMLLVSNSVRLKILKTYSFTFEKRNEVLTFSTSQE